MLEVLVSIFIATLVLSGLVLYMTTSVRANYFARKLRLATLYAEKKLEELKNTNFDAIANGSDRVEGFTRNWRVQLDGTSSRLKQVSITVSWADVLGKTHSITIYDYIYKQ
ncbi:MAG: type IV pilus modification PilV family protein [bacterium]